MPDQPPPEVVPVTRSTPREALGVLWVFLKLGLTSFGGPAAHLGYFRSEFVHRRRWLDDASYSELVALCQFLPGPASSQVGMALGLGRAGWWGALAAWLGFTMPSAAALVALAYGVAEWPALASSGVVQGLKVAAVAVVAHAVWAMGRALCPDGPRLALAVLACGLVLAVPGATGQMAAVLLGGVAGATLLRPSPQPSAAAPLNPAVGQRTGAALLGVWLVLLLALPVLAAWHPSVVVDAVAAFYQAGSLVFGGGHVVLPLLQAHVVPPGWVSADAFVAGYGAAQAVPGPLFTFAAYLGALMPEPLGGAGGGLLMLVAVFLPGCLLVGGALPFWQVMTRKPLMRRAMNGINAAVVGVLGAALLNPVAAQGLQSAADAAVAAVALLLLLRTRLSPVWVVALCALAGWWLRG